jgi:hypothetical protein
MLTIIDPMASGKHCQIADGMLSDAGSTNGTELNGKLVRVIIDPLVLLVCAI